MLLIPCPHCGARHENEFTYGGSGSNKMPESESFDEWYAFLYERENAGQKVVELWHHTYGCRQWIRLKRDPTSNLFVTDAEKPQ